MQFQSQPAFVADIPYGLKASGKILRHAVLRSVEFVGYVFEMNLPNAPLELQYRRHRIMPVILYIHSVEIYFHIRTSHSFHNAYVFLRRKRIFKAYVYSQLLGARRHLFQLRYQRRKELLAHFEILPRHFILSEERQQYRLSPESRRSLHGGFCELYRIGIIEKAHAARRGRGDFHTKLRHFVFVGGDLVFCKKLFFPLRKF